MTERSKLRPPSLVPKRTAAKLMPKKAGLLVDTMAIGSPAWSCQTVRYRQGWRAGRDRKPMETLQKLFNCNHTRLWTGEVLDLSGAKVRSEAAAGRALRNCSDC